jgi:hypothetical protein
MHPEPRLPMDARPGSALEDIVRSFCCFLDRAAIWREQSAQAECLCYLG